MDESPFNPEPTPSEEAIPSGLSPAARGKSEVRNPKSEIDQSLTTSAATARGEVSIANRKSEIGNEVIHSRSVQMGSERLGVLAKMDLVEVRAARANRAGLATEAARADEAGLANVSTDETGDLFTALEVCPVDYKAGAPKEGQETNELWDTDKMQLGLQALILRDNGYTCNDGIIYYRATKQRVRLANTSELETWILQKIAEARQATG